MGARGIEATCVTRTTLRPRAPFDFDATVHKPSHFPTPMIAYERGRYWQTLRWGGEVLGVRLRDRGTRAAPRVELALFSATPPPAPTRAAIARELRWRFDLDGDLAPFGRAFRADPVLGPALRRRRGMRVSSAYSLCEYLVVALVLQNTTVRRSAQMLRALLERYGARLRFDGRELYAFWAPGRLAAASGAELRELKVGYRARALQRVSTAFAAAGGPDEGRLRRVDKAAVRAELLALYGIGPASVWYVLFDVFHHYDAFDAISPWEQKIYSRLLFGRDRVAARRILAAVRRRWGRWRMLAAHYVFEDLFSQHALRPLPWLADLVRL